MNKTVVTPVNAPISTPALLTIDTLSLTLTPVCYGMLWHQVAGAFGCHAAAPQVATVSTSLFFIRFSNIDWNVALGSCKRPSAVTTRLITGFPVEMDRVGTVWQIDVQEILSCLLHHQYHCWYRYFCIVPGSRWDTIYCIMLFKNTLLLLLIWLSNVLPEKCELLKDLKDCLYWLVFQDLVQTM